VLVNVLHNAHRRASFLTFLRFDLHQQVAHHHRDKRIHDLLDELAVMWLLVHLLADDRFDQRFHQYLIRLVFENAARHVVVVLENEFQFLNPVVQACVLAVQLLRLDVDIAETDKEKLGGAADLERVAILRHEQEHVSIVITEIILVDALRACAIEHIHQLKEIVLMRRDRAFVHFLVFDIKRLVKIFGDHTRKGTTQTQNRTRGFACAWQNFVTTNSKTNLYESIHSS
jgi:hypothetical protein